MHRVVVSCEEEPGGDHGRLYLTDPEQKTNQTFFFYHSDLVVWLYMNFRIRTNVAVDS